MIKTGLTREYYKEFRPDSTLAGYIDCFWVKRVERGDNAVTRIIPDGCTDIIFNIVGLDWPIYLVGIADTYNDKSLSIQSHYFGIRFLPGGLFLFLQIPMDEFTNSSIELRDSSKTLAERLSPCLNEQLTDQERIILATSILKKHLQYQTNNVVHERILQLAKEIYTGRINLPLKTLIDKSCLSERQFQRKFKEYVGLCPKGLSRVMRFSKAFHIIKKNQVNSITELSHNLGYYDHSHLYKDFNKFYGKALPND